MLTTIVKTISTKIKLETVIKEAPDTYTFKFSVPGKINWAPGAYAHFLNNDLSCGQKVNKDEVREFSIMTHPNEKLLGFTTRIRKNASNFKSGLLDLKPGDEIRLFKIGNHLKGKMVDKPVVFISMGVGISTFRPLILESLNQNFSFPVKNINIDRSGEFVFANELEQLSGEKLKNIFVTNRNDLYKQIDLCVGAVENTYYVVGSKDFNNVIGNYLRGKKVAETDIVFDKH